MKILKKGFTLAEILITLTIIGVVAAVTLPALQNNVNKQALEKQTVKAFNTLVEAHDRYLADNHLDNVNSAFISPNNVRRYFNVVAQGTTDDTGFFADSYTSVDGSNNKFHDLLVPSNEVYQLADGTVFTFGSGAGKSGNCISAKVDVNGPNGPNIIGYDYWIVRIDVPAEIPNPDEWGGYTDISDDASVKEECLEGNAYGCYGHFMRNGFKFDY